jgi:hypothetical protein
MLHWVDHGFGTPKQTITFYVWKIFFYALFGLIVAGAFTAGLEFDNIAGWWNEPILYQKLMIWTILMEILGLAATCGPMAFHFDPPIGGVLYWWQNDTLRVPPYPRHVKFTKGNAAHAVGHRPVQADRVLADHDDVPVGRTGGRDARGERRHAAAVGRPHLLRAHLDDGPARQDRVPVGPVRAVRADAAVLRACSRNFVDMIVAAKIFIVVVWMGAGFSKLQHGFSSTVAIMVQNTPWMVFKNFRRRRSRTTRTTSARRSSPTPWRTSAAPRARS